MAGPLAPNAAPNAAEASNTPTRFISFSFHNAILAAGT
jgi:hypothetical protein